jgi:signal transduction histidine kinase/ActR/RegA family two-component response regulator
MVCDLTEKMMEEMFEDEQDREILRVLKPHSYIAVPLLARGRVLGAITMVSTSPDRACGTTELALAEELGQRAALALDNAGLYKAAQQARMEAERANLAKDQFLAMLSHELRTPLMPILATVLSLECDENLPEDVRPSMQMIRRNVELEARLIDDLLDLTRISKGKVQLNLERVDAHASLRSALEICGPEIRDKQLRVETNLTATHFQLEADPARLQQVFWNLIKNAVKFTPSGGELRVTTSGSAETELQVEIADSGMGIDADLLPKIFDAFEQGERYSFGGLGLGLAITKAIVELHKGSISAESGGRDRGSKFTVRLPVAAVAKAEDQPQMPAEWTPARKYTRILLVEDHEDTNTSLTRLLRRRGYQVLSAHNVKAALDLANQEEFDVLVSDMGLPDGTGLELMQKLTEADHAVFGIALTGFGMESDIRKSHAAGFHHHLIKPVDLNKLDGIIQQVAVRIPDPA